MSAVLEDEATMQLLQLQSFEHGKGEGTQAFTSLSYGLLLFVLPWAEQTLSELKMDFLTTCPRWISEFVKCLVEIQGRKLSVEHKVIIMKVLLVPAEGWEVQDRVRRQTCLFCLCTADLQALLLSLLTLTTHVERVIMGIMESMSWGSIISQTDFTLHSLQLLRGKHDFSQKKGNDWKTEAKKPRRKKTLLMKE